MRNTARSPLTYPHHIVFALRNHTLFLAVLGGTVPQPSSCCPYIRRLHSLDNRIYTTLTLAEHYSYVQNELRVKCPFS